MYYYYYTDPRQHGIYMFWMIKKQDVVNDDVIYVSVFQQTLNKNHSKCVYNSAHHVKGSFKLKMWYVS